MKKLYTIFIFLINISAWSQFSCEGAVILSHEFSQQGITTPGTGSAPGTWVTSATLCGTAGQYHHNCFTSVGDDYVFSYTTGEYAGESVAFTIKTNINYIGLLAFTGCNGSVFNGCLDWKYAPNLNTTMTVTASNLPANQTIYFGVGIWSTPNNLAFDVVNFTVTPPAMGVEDITLKRPLMYPNPVTDLLNISHTETIQTIEIYNVVGQKIVQEAINREEARINVEKLPSGHYTVLIKTDNASFTQKIVK